MVKMLVLIKYLNTKIQKKGWQLISCNSYRSGNLGCTLLANPKKAVK